MGKCWRRRSLQNDIERSENIRMTLPFWQFLEKPLTPPHSVVTVWHVIGVLRLITLLIVTLKLVGCQFKLPGHLTRLSDLICYMRLYVVQSLKDFNVTYRSTSIDAIMRWLYWDEDKLVISCAVKGCHSSRFNHLNLSFHRLKKDISYRAKWLDYLRRGKDYPQDKNVLLCSTHFQSEYFQRGLDCQDTIFICLYFYWFCQHLGVKICECSSSCYKIGTCYSNNSYRGICLNDLFSSKLQAARQNSIRKEFLYFYFSMKVSPAPTALNFDKSVPFIVCIKCYAS